MNFIIVPFKNFKEAKSRIRRNLPDINTARIVKFMLEDVLYQVKKSKISDRNFIVTKDKEAIKLAERIGIDILLEKNQISESTSVDWASKQLVLLGGKNVLRIPSDIPLVKSEDIDEIFDYALINNSCVIVPSRSGTGTNAILRNPPNVIPSFFGSDSLKKHIEAFKKKNITYLVVKNTNIALDIDCTEDLAKLRSSKVKNQTTKYLFNSIYKNC